jgi:hypothetical protein
MLLLGAGCGKPVSVDQTPPPGTGCHAGDAYEFKVLEDYEAGGNPPWFGAPDMTGWMAVDAGFDASVRVAVGTTLAVAPNPAVIKPIENGGRCGSTQSMVLEASGNKDWGGFWGDWSYSSTTGPGLDASGWEGLAFWGRSKGIDADGAPFPTDPGMIIELSDKHSTSGLGSNPDAGVDSSGNVITSVADAGDAGYCVDVDGGYEIVLRDSNGNVLQVAGMAATNSCGNLYRRPLVLTSDWRLYLLPFSSFYQDPRANRNPAGLDPSAIYLISIRPPKEAVAGLWIDDFGLYRAKGAGSDQ